MIKASVVVVTHNRVDLLQRCLGQLIDQTISEYEIIVVDDGSTDKTPEMMAKYSQIRYIRNQTQQGQPVVRNIGIKEARGDIIIFVDSDVMVARKFVEDHIQAHKKNKRLIVQGLVRHIRNVKEIGGFSLRIDGLSKALVTQNVSVRKEWLVRVGMMDERFGIGMGYEDTDLGKRLRASGLKTKYGWRKCFAYHVDGYITLEKLRNVFEKRYQWSKNIVYFGEKHGRHFVKREKVFFFSWLFQTDRWVEKESAFRLLVNSVDSPLFFITPVLMEIMKYHYRAKGIREGTKFTLNSPDKSHL